MSKLEPASRALVPLRLFLLYALLVGVFPTVIVWSDFGNLEATEEEWDRVIVLSVLVSIPLVVAAWAAFRNLRRVPVLAGFVALLTVFHLWTTSVACMDGFLGEPYSDPALNAQSFEDYGRFFAYFSTPFVAAYLIWCFWPKKMQAPAVT